MSFLDGYDRDDVFEGYGEFDRDDHDQLATLAEADREYADNVGAMNPDQAWILSDRDVWYKNPAYRGAPQPHPEDYHSEDE